MTWLWPICFSLFVIAASCAEISGEVQLRDSREASVRKGGDFSGVVVSLVPVEATEISTAPSRHLKMLQKNKTFSPHVLPIQVGTVVDFPNLDPIFHNAFSSYSGQVFDVGLYSPGASRAVRFARPGVVRVFCNIHPSMSAVIVVLNTPYFTVTGPDGRFALDVPAGKYELHVFHERASEATLSRMTRVLQAGADPLSIPSIVISEAGYLPAPHKNKYGRPYPADTNDQSVYPGVRP